MAADFYAPGAIDIFFAPRDASTFAWRYLGTCVTAPEIDAEIITTPFTTNLLGPAPFQEMFNSEMHRVTATLNRLDFNNWLFMRTMFSFGAITRGFDNSPSNGNRTAPGQPILHNKDFKLLLLSSNLLYAPEFPAPPGATISRIYYSCTLSHYHETTENSRVEEVSVVIECHPKYKQKTITSIGSQSGAADSRPLKATSSQFLLYTDNGDIALPALQTVASAPPTTRNTILGFSFPKIQKQASINTTAEAAEQEKRRKVAEFLENNPNVR